MTKSVQPSKINKKKVALASAVSASLLITSGYALGTSGTFNSQPVSASPSNNNSQTLDSNRKDSALVINAAEVYLTSKGAAPDSNQVYDLQLDGNNARGKFLNSDSGSVFYARYVTVNAEGRPTDGQWVIVYNGQSAIPANLVKQYRMPNSWTNQMSW